MRKTTKKTQMTEAELKKKEQEKLNRDALKKCKCYAVKDAEPNPWRIKSLPTQRLIDKLTRDHNLNVCFAWLDQKDKCIYAIHAVNANDKEKATYSYDDVCAFYGWKKIIVSSDCQTVTPKW